MLHTVISPNTYHLTLCCEWEQQLASTVEVCLKIKTTSLLEDFKYNIIKESWKLAVQGTTTRRHPSCLLRGQKYHDRTTAAREGARPVPEEEKRQCPDSRNPRSLGRKASSKNRSKSDTYKKKCLPELK